MAQAISPVRGTTWTPLVFTWFRWLWIASIVSNIGTWMQNVGAAWWMATVAPSALLVALVQTATSLPVFLLGVPAGAIGDIINRRKLLLVTQGWMLAAAAILGFLTLTRAMSPWVLLWLTFALGLGSAMNGPAWQAIMPELVPREELPAAIALNSVGFNLARAIGPALGGVVVAAAGAGAAFVLNAISFVGVMIVLYVWRQAPEHATASNESVGAAIWAGMRYVRFAPSMHAVLLRSGTFVIAASALWSILPLVAKNELHSESSGFGLMLACLGAGSIVGALIIGRMRRSVSAETIVTSSVVLFGLVSMALPYLENIGLVAVVLLFGGVAWMWVNSSLNTSAQTSLPAWVRARALAAYLLVFQGCMAVGSVIWGEVAVRFGLRATLVAAGLTLLVAAAATSRLRLTPAAGLDTTPSNHWPDPQPLGLVHPERGPVLVTVEYRIDPPRGLDFVKAMRAVRTIRRRDGAVRWGLWEDPADPGRYTETFVVESWAEHMRQHERVTVSDRQMEDKAWAFHLGPEPPKVTHWLAARD